MSSNPLFSVLIANYNDGRYIMQAIESVLEQSYKNWEIIIVDDHSTDNSIEIINTLNDNRIHTYQNDRNYGCGYTKHRCVELAQGEICGFVDADDYIVEDALEIMVDAHIKNPPCSLIYSQFYFTDKDLNIISISDHQCSIPSGETFLTCKKPGAISAFATFKMDHYKKTEKIDISLRLAEDIDLYFKLEEVGKTLFLPTPLYYYRTNTGNNTSLDKNKMWQVLGWDLIARGIACRRRGLPIDQYSFLSLESFQKESFKLGEDAVRKSKTYRLGKALLHPLKKLLRKNDIK